MRRVPVEPEAPNGFSSPSAVAKAWGRAAGEASSTCVYYCV